MRKRNGLFALSLLVAGCAWQEPVERTIVHDTITGREYVSVGGVMRRPGGAAEFVDESTNDVVVVQSYRLRPSTQPAIVRHEFDWSKMEWTQRRLDQASTDQSKP